LELNMDLSELMQMATQLRGQLTNVQNEAGNLTVCGDSGAGLVKVEMNGRYEVLRVQIDPKAVVPDETGLLEDLVRAAVNQASGRVAEQLRSTIGSLVGELGLDLRGLGLDPGPPTGKR
jgi:DNA-binding YbaB/EbfC family protein